MKESLLYLVHRVPFPPNKGDKIRSFNILKYLSKSYSVYLGAFVDDKDDEKYIERLEEYSVDSCLVRINPKINKLRSLSGFLTGMPLSIPYYSNKVMRQWVGSVIREHKINHCVVFSSQMAQYLLPYAGDMDFSVMDFVDVDSDKWLQYSNNQSWPMSYVYRRESKRLFDYEKSVAGSFSHSIFVSASEAELFKKRAPDLSEKIDYLNNGVDTDYFSRDSVNRSPYPEKAEVVVFTGAMDYWANVDAVSWFVNEVLPIIKEQRPQVLFYIVGANPSHDVRVLGGVDNVVVTGGVDDVRPYLKHATIAVAPMRIARGIQNKVLEALAMGLPVVCTSNAAEGIEVGGKLVLDIEDDVVQFAECVKKRLSHPYNENDQVKAREFVRERYSWSASLDRLGCYLS